MDNYLGLRKALKAEKLKIRDLDDDGFVVSDGMIEIPVHVSHNEWKVYLSIGRRQYRILGQEIAVKAIVEAIAALRHGDANIKKYVGYGKDNPMWKTERAMIADYSRRLFALGATFVGRMEDDRDTLVVDCLARTDALVAMAEEFAEELGIYVEINEDAHCPN